MGIAKFIKFLVILLVFSAFVFSVAYSWGSVETIYHFKTQTAQCPVSEAQTGCPTISEHISSLQMLVTTLPDTRTILSVLFILLAVAVLGSYFIKQPNVRLAPIGRLFHIKNPELSLFNYLKIAFARGILNPKIY